MVTIIESSDIVEREVLQLIRDAGSAIQSENMPSLIDARMAINRKIYSAKPHIRYSEAVKTHRSTLEGCAKRITAKLDELYEAVARKDVELATVLVAQAEQLLRDPSPNERPIWFERRIRKIALDAVRYLDEVQHHPDLKRYLMDLSEQIVSLCSIIERLLDVDAVSKAVLEHQTALRLKGEEVRERERIEMEARRKQQQSEEARVIAATAGEVQSLKDQFWTAVKSTEDYDAAAQIYRDIRKLEPPVLFHYFSSDDWRHMDTRLQSLKNIEVGGATKVRALPD